MSIKRNNAQKDILYLTDFPLAEEANSKQPYSTFSHKQLQRHLEEASSFINRFAALKLLYGEAAEPLKHLPKTKFLEAYNKDFKGKMLENTAKLGVDYVCYTYLSLNRPSEGDSDWTKSVVSKKSIPAGEEEAYVQCEWLKDTWVSSAVWKELQDCLEQIKQVQPKLIVIGGKWALFFLATLLDGSETQLTTIARTKTTFKRKIFFGELNKYRASLLKPFECLQLPEAVVIPILNPAFGWVVPDKERIMKKDYERVASIYRQLKDGKPSASLLNFTGTITILEKFEDCISFLKDLYGKLEKEQLYIEFDVETRSHTIDCINVTPEDEVAYVIPLTYMHEYINDKEETVWYKDHYETVPAGQTITIDRNYWEFEQEAEVLYWLHKCMLHIHCLHVGQNYAYDCQWYFREWGLSINAAVDTMILHHVLYNFMQKDLALLASLYDANYTQWKHEISGDNRQRWFYNGKDGLATRRVRKVLMEVIANEEPSLQQFYVFQQSQVCKHITTLMNRGVNVDNNLKELLKTEYTALQQHALELLRWLVHDNEFNPDSPAQVRTLFKELCDIKPIIDKKTKSETFGAKAMIVYLEEYPEWKTLLHLYLEYKRLGVFVRTFLSARLSEDGKMRCSYNVAGTKTYRLASRKNIDGGGLNLQNIPSGARGGFKLTQCLQDYRGEESEDSLEDLVEDGVENEEFKSVIDLGANFGRVKDMFIPDSSDWIFFDADYSAIDLQFVVWESDCSFLKAIIKRGEDVYSMLASHYYQREITKKDEERQIFKAVCHGSNYKGLAPTLAAMAGLSVPAVKRVQDFYFSKCPEIPAWWNRIDNDVRTKGYTTNIFGARFWCVDLKDPMYMNKMVASPIQGAAGILVNKALCNLEEHEQHRLNGIQARLQVHDSIAGLIHVTDTTALTRIKQYMEIVIPYKDDPLVIPAAVKTSAVSYGQCH